MNIWKLFRRRPSLAMPPMREVTRLAPQPMQPPAAPEPTPAPEVMAAEAKAYHAEARAERKMRDYRESVARYNQRGGILAEASAEFARAWRQWQPEGNHRAAVSQLIRDADAQIAFCADDLPLMPDIAEPHPEWWSRIQADLRERATVNPLPQRVCMEHLKQHPQDASITLTIFAPQTWGNGNDIIELAKARLLASVASALGIQAVEQCMVTWKRVARDPAWTLVIWHKGDQKAMA